MTLNVTIPETVYREIIELASQQQVSVERFVASALAENLAGWSRVQQMAEQANREDFLAVLAKVPSVDPLPEDRLDATEG